MCKTNLHFKIMCHTAQKVYNIWISVKIPFVRLLYTYQKRTCNHHGETFPYLLQTIETQ